MQTLLHTYLMVPSSDDGGEVVCSNQFEIYHHTSDYAKPQKCGLEMYVVARRLRERESLQSHVFSRRYLVRTTSLKIASTSMMGWT
jgi:hypothetical protein